MAYLQTTLILKPSGVSIQPNRDRKNPYGLLLPTLIAFTFVSASAFGKARTTSPAPPRTFSTVVIDAGHGGHDRGGIPGQKVAEKDLALDVALRLRTQLNAAGFRTMMTRTTDVFVPLGQRVAVANANRDAIFVSIHFNASRRSWPRGIETFYRSKQSSTIAVRIQNQLASAGRTANRGVKRARFYVLRNSRIPSVLTECGFLTNSQDAALAVKASYRQQLAEAIATAVCLCRGNP
jgi:N-acetylmuramoyl-L-alanine amidase